MRIKLVVTMVCSLGILFSRGAGARRAVPASPATVHVVIATEPLMGNGSGPFTLLCVLTDGNGLGDGNSTITLSAADFGGGAITGGSSTFGGASGDFASGVRMSDTAAVNTLTQPFIPGTVLRFDMTSNQVDDEADIPDRFTFSILDGSGLPIPTQAPAADYLMAFDINNSTDAYESFATDPTRGAKISLAAPTIDGSAPTIVPHVVGTLGTPPWYSGTVALSWSVSDPESGITSSTGCEPETLSVDTTDTSVLCFATNGVGLSALASVVLKIDKTAPTITPTRLPAPNENGWNNTPVSVAFDCTDTTSGLGPGSPSPPVIVATEGIRQGARGTCNDNAGNSASAVVGDINVDFTAPVISVSRSSHPNAAGWYNKPVTVVFQCSDTLSGLAPGSPPKPLTLGDGFGQTASGTCTDLAGNSSSASVDFINVDLSSPTITALASRPTLWPPNGQFVPETISGVIRDRLSGIDGSSIRFRVIDEYGTVQPAGSISVAADGTYSFTVMLEAARRGQDVAGRHYAVVVTANDLAGNGGSTTVIVTVPHDHQN